MADGTVPIVTKVTLAKAKLLKEALVMDSASNSVDLIGNRKYVSSIHKALVPLDLNTTGGTAEISKQADMTDYGKVWFQSSLIFG